MGAGMAFIKPVEPKNWRIVSARDGFAGVFFLTLM